MMGRMRVKVPTPEELEELRYLAKELRGAASMYDPSRGAKQPQILVRAIAALRAARPLYVGAVNVQELRTRRAQRAVSLLDHARQTLVENKDADPDSAAARQKIASMVARTLVAQETGLATSHPEALAAVTETEWLAAILEWRGAKKPRRGRRPAIGVRYWYDVLFDLLRPGGTKCPDSRALTGASSARGLSQALATAARNAGKQQRE